MRSGITFSNFQGRHRSQIVPRSWGMGVWAHSWAFFVGLAAPAGWALSRFVLSRHRGRVSLLGGEGIPCLELSILSPAGDAFQRKLFRPATPFLGLSYPRATPALAGRLVDPSVYGSRQSHPGSDDRSLVCHPPTACARHKPPHSNPDPLPAPAMSLRRSQNRHRQAERLSGANNSGALARRDWIL
jgi:hypothetical protein